MTICNLYKMTKNNLFSWEKVQKPFFVMAPMDGITSSPFRRVEKKLGADIVFSEMIAAEAVYYKSKKTVEMMKFHEEERPIIIQIFGNDAEKMASATQWIEKNIKPDGIDINMGCPAKKVIAGGRGCALLLDPEKAVEIVRAVRGATKLPLSVKTRVGWEEFDVLPLIQEFESLGIDAVTIHGRTKTQGFAGEPDLNAIKKIKDSVKIPVIGNGGIKNINNAKNMLEITGCDGVMVGRGALGNPWLFRSFKSIPVIPTPSSVISTEVEKSLSLKNYKPTFEETVKTALWHLDMSIEEFGPKKGIFDMRKHYGWYFKGFDGASELRKKLVIAENIKEVRKILL
ncbi:tRNA dihydrouridine synthase DusB [candidate division WS5 bacterium]|uniref:tRNA-dihydrouridine synthase n=1 Tax=candidate division WS5 bacterium TaxID=2093353 RepID=A0A419DEC1_9BACT|nr:MAG: tRNA dihydrouridine synthase DusB [candidate division WS5 bacterium]